LGLDYNWSEKEYFFERQRLFPSYLQQLCQQIIQETESTTGYKITDYMPQAGIVNFYGTKDNLMAHQDRSELNTTAPLISFSLGNSCIFLMGGEDINIKPQSYVLESGDVALMYGPARRAFHGVPRILEGTCPDELLTSLQVTNGEGELQNVSSNLMSAYMKTHRININVRMVF
jgi:alkylated DNA repair protein alkB family protein 1